MYQGKYRKWKRSACLLASLVLLLFATVIGSVAFLATNDGSLKNIFLPSEVPNKVVETAEGTEKKDVRIKNTGNIDGYIRAEVVFNWIDEFGKIYGSSLEKDVDYEITWITDSGWVEGNDGYYYYTEKVAPGDETGILFIDCKVKEGKAPYDHQFCVTVVGQSIQADGTDSTGKPVVETIWPVTVNADGTLTVQQ